MTTTVRGRRRPVERRPPTRRRYLARRWVALLVVLAVLGLGYVLMFTSVVGVREVAVFGTRDLSHDQVRETASIELGAPMVRLDTEEIALRVAELPRVFEVRVSRSWPSTVEITVTERDPVAVRLAGDDVHLIDRTGLDYATVEARPKELPVLRVENPSPDDAATRAAVTVLQDIPDQLRERVVEVSAETAGSVRLTLAGKKIVNWGDAEDNTRKAAVLAPLLTRPGKIYDVTTPDFPTVS
ncbi:cell division protein FtsQ/DivIB [Actinophytocola gossypii]|uniref:FtsQ-type POTRA domain-containing protein n=1 Tax=Actinophytocola gossypii TaxID=2812003 RepID=A0ABT2JBI9_9PSEU|nr:FtsQ-type POTRA domain-containing protein [Actinophytocola gossypii]MCT2585231.1 FtsQ-type POTRA domain-containing protein [Actinophytocola gossypii]